MLPFVIGLLGVLVGAFAAHAAETIMARRTLTAPVCPYCRAPYHVWQWSAVLSWLSGQHTCHDCGKPVRWTRLAGELFLALTWGMLAARYSLSWRVCMAMVAAVPLSMVLVTDLEARLIPNRIMLPALALMLVTGTLAGPAVPGLDVFLWWHALLGGLVGFLVFWLLGVVGVALLGEGALGAGDVKLAAYVGAVVGFPLVVEALVLTFLLGGVGAGLVLLSKRGALRMAIPYGPFLVLGGAVVMLYGLEIARWFFG